MKKITFRFTNAQIEVLYFTLRAQIMRPVNSQDFETRLYLCELMNIGRRIHSKMYLNEKKKYQLTLTLPESLAFFCYFNPILNELPGDLERVIITGVCNSIHQQLT